MNFGEIEAALNDIDELKESAVVAVSSEGFENNLICCAFCSKTAAVAPREIRLRLKGRLPAYMLPSKWLHLEALPRNANGKVDRPLLREQFKNGIQTNG